MKILCVIDSLGSGGAQRQLVELAKGFKEKDHNVSFLVYHPQDFYWKELENSNIGITYIEEPSYLKRLFKMRRFIRNGNYDAVLSFLEAANCISTFASFPYRKWKLVVGERSANPNILNSLKLRFYRWMHLFADYVVANSKVNIDIVKEANPLLSDKKCKVLYNFTTMKEDAFNASVKTNSKTIVAIPASYRRVKNLEGLIEGINLLDEKHKNSLIVNWFGSKEISNGNNYFTNALNKIKEYNLENIIILNDVATIISDEYRKSHFVGLISHFEGFPNVICEAMTMGMPIITSRVSDLPDIIMENKNGFLCESTDVESIAEAFRKAIDTTDEKRKKIGMNNLKKANHLFNKNKIVEEYLKLLS